MDSKNLLTLLTLGFACLPQHGFALSAFVEANMGTGQVSGYIQTPKGGSFETTSLNRPTFSEAGIHQDTFYDLAGGVEHNGYTLKASYLHLHPHGTNTLKSNLLTHTQFIYANQAFKMNLHFDWYYFELSKRFDFSQGTWSITPLIDLNWLHYDYQFWSYPVNSQRAFTLLNTTFGLNIERYFAPEFSLYAEGKSTLPKSNLQLYNIQAGIHYHLKMGHHIEWMPQLAIGFMQIDYEDEQPVPNHIRYTSLPYAQMGLQVKWY